DGLAHRVAAVAVHDDQPPRRQAAGTIDDMAQQRLAGQGMQHLREVGAHPFALARGKDDDIHFSLIYQKLVASSRKFVENLNMRSRLLSVTLVTVFVLLLCGCSSVWLGYSSLPSLIAWRVDRDLALDDAQRQLVGEHI